MRISRTLVLSSLTAAACLAWQSGDTNAQDSWSGGSPVFQSDIQKRQQQLEAQRAERRKNYAPVSYPAYMKGGEKPDIAPEKPPIVYLDGKEEPGTIVVATKERKLYYVLPGGKAYAYPISVGRDGFTWTGTERISRIAHWPSWTPPAEMRQRQKGLPITVSGGLINPLGARALYLGGTIYRIHGTNNERSIGRANSSGCFRLMNAHVIHLASLAKVGTKVRVVSSYSGVSSSAPLSSLFSAFAPSEEPKPKSKVKSRRTKGKQVKKANKLVKTADKKN